MERAARGAGPPGPPPAGPARGAPHFGICFQAFFQYTNPLNFAQIASYVCILVVAFLLWQLPPTKRMCKRPLRIIMNGETGSSSK